MAIGHIGAPSSIAITTKHPQPARFIHYLIRTAAHRDSPSPRPSPTAHRTASKQYAASTTASPTRNLLPPLPQRRSRRRPHRKYPVCSVGKYAFCDIFGCLVARKRTCWTRSSSSSSAAACTDASILLRDSRRILNAVAWRSGEYARCGYCDEYQDEGGLGGDSRGRTVRFFFFKFFFFCFNSFF